MEAPPSPASRRPLTEVDAERVRFSFERTVARQLEALPGFTMQRKALVTRDAEATRRRLVAQALRLTPSMASDAYRQATEAARVLGVEGTLELYQSSGRENAALHLVRSPILLEIQGRMLTLLDEGAALALFGHELGHYLAHGPWNELGATALAGMLLADQGLLSESGTRAAAQLSVAREITADRFGLLATQELHAALRLEMAATTGLPSSALSWDTTAYLNQCNELMAETLADGEAAKATTHPEHSLRAWAIGLFWETKEFAELTGQGPGTRTLEEIDAQIVAAIGGSQVEAGQDVRQEPPAYLIECALAGAVLIAHADGVLAPEEIDAIEDAFAHRVPGWSELLDPDVALERFYETGGLVRASGPDLARSMFLMLSHVMGADDVVDAREVQMLLAIGDALGQGAVFRRFIGPAVEAMGGTLEVETLEPVAVPLPVPRDEVRDALGTLADNVARRGEQWIAPRRLLRLAGCAVEDDGARERVEKGLAAHDVECEPALTVAGLDDMLRLRSTRPRPEPQTDAEDDVPLDRSRQALLLGLTRLRDELVTGDGRSPSVRLRRLRAVRSFDLCRLDGIRTGAAERALALITGGKSARLVTADDAGRHDAAHACARDLRQLDRTNRDRREETGAYDLYLGYPLVIGNVAPRGEQDTGYGVRAPLLLHPVTLERDGRGTRGFTAVPREPGSAIANQSLLRVLFNKAELALPDELARTLDEQAGDPAQGIEAVLATLAEVGLSLRREGNTLVPFRERNADLDEAKPFVAIEECAVLGIFPQSSSDLLQDYDALLRDLSDPKADVEALLAAGEGLLPSVAEAPTEGETHDNGEPANADNSDDILRWPVLPADPSQRGVAAACRRHRVTVVDGPPGTGKSQLIVNLVAQALARGERVAVVAEKRAALDVVYQRLDGCGLSDSIALVHDVADDRRALYRKIGARIRDFSPRAHDHARYEILRQEHAQVTARLETRRAALAHRPEGVERSVGELLAMVAGARAPSVLPSLADLDARRLNTMLELAERLHPHRDRWAPAGWWRTEAGETTRGSFAGLDDAGLLRTRSTVQDAMAIAQQLDATLHADPVDREALVAAAPILERVAASQATRSQPGDAALLIALLASPDAPIEATVRQWDEQAEALGRCAEPVTMAVDEQLVRNVAIARSYAGKWTRVFAGTWWTARGELRTALAQVWPEQAATGLSAEFLGRVQDRIVASQAWAGRAALLQSLGLDPTHATLADADTSQARARLDRMVALQAQVRDLRAHAAALQAVGVALPTTVEQLAAFEQRVAVRAAHVAAVRQLDQAIAPVASLLPWLSAPSAQQLGALSERLAHDGPLLREADGWLQQLDACHPQGRTVLDTIATAHPQADGAGWRDAIAHAWAAAHLDKVRGLIPALTDLGTGAEAQRAAADTETLRRLEQEIRTQQLARLGAALDKAELLHVPDAAYRARRSPQQKLKESLLKEVGKKRNLWPMRRFVRELAPQGLLGVLPCWLLSPETMVVLFPRQPLFDLVIFDEASQCTVESGLPVALRAHRVVIAGDEQQMPPSSFFRLGSSGTEDDDRSEEERAARDVFAAESLLALARARCPHVGLQWHYRCREEELIAFSNHAMYEGSLRTIPSVRSHNAKPALRWISVENGEYDRGLNRPEAERVVTLIDELLQRPEPPTVGVVTFNLRQRETVLEAIDARVEKDQAFAERWDNASGAEALDARPFVKNLESVQGDERDVIVFSLGHAPVQRTRKGGASELYVPARFGPLGQRGGERRLNVAISRAKAECYVVSSFDPALLHVGNSTHPGPRLFKGFLQFAHHLEHGRRSQAERILDEVRDQAIAPRGAQARLAFDGYVPLPAQLALALEERGLRCALDLGRSDFRVPLAVAHPDSADRFCVAVMCDEGQTETSVFEQHVHQPAVLGLRGWDVLWVTAADWARRPSDVLAAIEGRVLPPAAAE